MVAQVAVDVYRVLDVESIERDGSLADGRCELILKQAHVVVVDVDICKYLFKQRVQYLARLQQVVDTFLALTLDNVLLLLRILAIDVLCNSLFHADGQDELVVVWRCLNLILHIRLVLVLARYKVFGLDIVQSERYLLIFVVLIVVVVLKVRQLLGSYNALHEFYGRVVLARVAFALLLDNHLAKSLRVLLEHNLHVRRSVGANLDSLWNEAYATECEFPTIVSCNGKLAVHVACCCHMMALIYSACQRNRVSVAVINFTGNLCLGCNDQDKEHQCNT